MSSGINPFNPFINRTLPLAVDWKHGLSIALAAIVLLPVRIVLTVVTCLLAVIVAYLVPLWPGGPFGACLRYLIRFQLVILGLWWVHVHGQPAPRNEAPIVVANHSSLIEGIWLQWYLGASTLTAIENATRPVIGRVAAGLGTIWVDRRAHNGSVVTAIKEHVARPDAARLLIFPEGTCGNGLALATFRTGAFVPLVPVQPVAIRYNFSRFDPSWCSCGPDLYGLVLRMMLSWYTSMEVTYLPVVQPSATPSVVKIEEFTKQVRTRIATELEIPVTEYSFDDVKLAGEAQKNGADPAIGLIEFTRFNREELGGKLTYEDALRAMQLYSKQSADGFKALLRLTARSSN